MGTRLEAISAEQMRIAAAGVVPLPMMQSTHWDALVVADGGEPWGRYEWFDGDKRCAVISLVRHEVRGFAFLWARQGPVWLKEASPEREAAFRRDLMAEVRRRDPKVVFVRLHATYSAPDLVDPFQTITYDRTVVIDCSGGTEESVAASMTTDGRRAVRRARARMAEAGAVVVEETGLSAEAFAEYYAILVETAERDGFRPHPIGYYTRMLDVLGPERARLFGVRLNEGRGVLVCWDLVLVNDGFAAAAYGAHTLKAREVLGPDALDFSVAVTLAGEGVTGFDLMGAHSPRVPQLFRVGKYKRRFAQHFTDVPGCWEMPVRPARYRLMVALAGAKRRLLARR